jgi:hypothetical protein
LRLGLAIVVIASVGSVGCRGVVGIDDKYFSPRADAAGSSDGHRDAAAPDSARRDAGDANASHRDAVAPDATRHDASDKDATVRDAPGSAPLPDAARGLGTLDVAVWEGGSTAGFGTPRDSVALAWSGRAGKVLAFGGLTDYWGNQAVDTALFWHGLAKGWIAVPLPDAGVQPSPRGGATTTEVGSDVLLYGGVQGVGGTPEAFTDTWKFDGSKWTELCGQGACGIDAPLRGAVIAGLPDGTAILFGGESGHLDTSKPPQWVRDSYQADTYRFDGATWRKLAPAFTPGAVPPRAHAALVADAARRRLVLFGGQSEEGGVLSDLDDTWEFDPDANGGNGEWACACGCYPDEPCGPHGRFIHAMTYDTLRQRVILFGGFSSNPSLLSDYGDTWEWRPDLHSWDPRCGTAHVPSCDTGLMFSRPTGYQTLEREDAGFAFDRATGRAVLAGGYFIGYLNDTFEYHVRGGSCANDGQCDTGYCVGESTSRTCCEVPRCAAGETCDRSGAEGICSQ